MGATLRETNLWLPGQVGEVYHGKVGDVYTIDHDGEELLAVVRTDRISVRDVVLDENIPYKGQVLNQMSAHLLRKTADVAPNWFIDSPDPNVSVGHKANPILVEMIVRGHLLGSAWTAYDEHDMRELCGEKLPDGLKEFDAIEPPIVTPITKVNIGHDTNITLEEIVDSGLATKEQCLAMHDYSLDLFLRGQSMAHERGLELGDTKHEYGLLPNGELVLIDEVHTPDSSRYYSFPDLYKYLVCRGERPKELSKEFVRDWADEQGFHGEPNEEKPHMDPEFIDEVTHRYISLYEQMTGETIEPVEASSEQEIIDRITANLESFLASL